MADNTLGIIVTPRFIIAWPQLAEPKPFIKNGKPRGEPMYTAVDLFDPADIGDIKKKIAAVATAKWGSTDGVRSPLKKGEVEKAKAEKKGKNGDFYDGKIVLKMKSKFRPRVVDRNREEILDLNKVYSGCICRAELNLVAVEMDNDDGPKKYVTAYFNFLMKVADGDRIIGRSASDVFADVEGEDTDYNPSSGLDDEIPF